MPDHSPKTDPAPFESGSLSTHKLAQAQRALGVDKGPSSHPVEMDSPANPGLPGLEDLQKKLDALSADLATAGKDLEEAKAKIHEAELRGLAEVENTRRRFQREREELLRYSNEPLLRDLLQTVDNFENSLAHLTPLEANQSLSKGVELTYKQLLSTLERFGVKPVDPHAKSFDPAIHEAIAKRAEPGAIPDKILAVHQKGYYYHDRLLRPMRVTVAGS